jgi:hypothetical protein
MQTRQSSRSSSLESAGSDSEYIHAYLMEYVNGLGSETCTV